MKSENGIAVLIFSVFITGFAAWVTHIMWLITLATGDEAISGSALALGVIAAFLPPIGAIHGVMLWLGVAAW